MQNPKSIFNILLNKNLTIINSTHDPDSFENIDSILKIFRKWERAIDIIQKNEKVLLINTKYKIFAGEDSNIEEEINF